jgi:hypothetical protein
VPYEFVRINYMKGLPIAILCGLVLFLFGFFYTQAERIEGFFAMSPGTMVQLASTRPSTLMLPYPMKKREYMMVDSMVNDQMERLYQSVAQPHWLTDRIGYQPYSLHDAIVVLDN